MKTRILHLLEALKRPSQFDFEVAVIGGGSAGLAAAQELKRHGKSVKVFDKQQNSKATVLSPYHVKSAAQSHTVQHIVIATGSSPKVPEFPGLDQVSSFTLDDFDRASLEAKRWLVVGGDAAGCELAQTLARQKSKVSLVHAEERLLTQEEPEISKALEQVLRLEGVEIFLNCKAKSFEKLKDLSLCVTDQDDEDVFIEFDHVLLALGRVSNVSGFGLEDLDLPLRPDGTLQTNEYLQTRTANIWACGEVTAFYQFNSAAALQGELVARNIVGSVFSRERWRGELMPRLTFTDPPIAQVGLTEAAARTQKVPVSVKLLENGRHKLIFKKDSEQILGATVMEKGAKKILSSYFQSDFLK